MKDDKPVPQVQGEASNYFESCSPEQVRWLQAYSQSGDAEIASKVSEVEHLLAMGWLKESEEFMEAFEYARMVVGYELEAAALSKAKSEDGSDRLMIELLRAMLPHKYDPNYTEDEDDEENHGAVVLTTTNISGREDTQDAG